MTMVIALTYSVTICVCLVQCRMIVGALHVAVLEQVHKTMPIMSRYIVIVDTCKGCMERCIQRNVIKKEAMKESSNKGIALFRTIM